jgi:hypothetical protein
VDLVKEVGHWDVALKDKSLAPFCLSLFSDHHEVSSCAPSHTLTCPNALPHLRSTAMEQADHGQKLLKLLAKIIFLPFKLFSHVYVIAIKSWLT